MSPGVHIMLSGGLTFGVSLAWGLHELWSLKRRPRGGGGIARQRLPGPPRPKPLPDCLIPKPMNLNVPRAAPRQRVPELV